MQHSLIPNQVSHRWISSMECACKDVDFLECARRKDKSAELILPHKDLFEIPMTKAVVSLKVKVEMLDIYHFLQERYKHGHFHRKVNTSSFSLLIACHRPKSMMNGLLEQEAVLRERRRTTHDAMPVTLLTGRTTKSSKLSVNGPRNSASKMSPSTVE